MRSVLHRCQDFATERLPWVQFPPERRMPQRPRAPFFRHAMPWEQRTLLGVLSLALLVGSFIALFFIGVLVWAIFTA